MENLSQELDIGHKATFVTKFFPGTVPGSRPSLFSIKDPTRN